MYNQLYESQIHQTMSIGEAIVDVRQRRGIKQKALAEACNISVATLCNIEKSKTYPTMPTINAISKALNVRASELVIAALTKEDVEEGKWELVQVLKDYLIGPVLKIEGKPSKKND